jgi:hypothetical protein
MVHSVIVHCVKGPSSSTSLDCGRERYASWTRRIVLFSLAPPRLRRMDRATHRLNHPGHVQEPVLHQLPRPPRSSSQIRIQVKNTALSPRSPYPELLLLPLPLSSLDAGFPRYMIF